MIVAVVGVWWSAGAVVGAASWRLDNVAVAAGLALVSRSRDQIGGAFARWTRACRQDSVSTRAEVGLGGMVSTGSGGDAVLRRPFGIGTGVSAKAHTSPVARSSVGRLAPLVLGAMRYGGRYGVDYYGSWQ